MPRAMGFHAYAARRAKGALGRSATSPSRSAPTRRGAPHQPLRDLPQRRAPRRWRLGRRRATRWCPATRSSGPSPRSARACGSWRRASAWASAGSAAPASSARRACAARRTSARTRPRPVSTTTAASPSASAWTAASRSRSPHALASEHAAPLLCAGITVYAPLRRHARPAMRVGVVGIGGLGHLALQFARAMGCEVTAFSASADKAGRGARLRRPALRRPGDAKALRSASGTLDFVLSTTFVAPDRKGLLRTLRPNGVLCLVGVPDEPLRLDVGAHARAAARASPRARSAGARRFARCSSSPRATASRPRSSCGRSPRPMPGSAR